MNCFLDSESCVVVDRASRRRKSTEDDANGEGTIDAASIGHLQRHGSAESSGEPPERGDGDVRMETTSDGGSCRPDALNTSTSGLLAANAPSSVRRPTISSLDNLPPHDPPQHRYSFAEARPRHLHWAGEQSTVFGSEVTYSYYAFLEVNNLYRLLPQDASYLELQGCLRVPKKTVLDEFVKQYFLHVHPIMPLINEGDFWEAYSSPPAEGSRAAKVSLLVFQAMLFAACAYVSRNSVRALGFSDMKAARASFYRRAKLIFDFEAESSPIAIAQASLLLSSWSPSADRQYSQTGSFWLGVAIRQAKLAGAHQYRSLYREQSAEARYATSLTRQNILKRLWWCTIVTDRMQSLCAQKPIQVTPLHFSHEDMRNTLTSNDFVDEIERSRVYNSGAKGALLKIFVHISQLAVALTDCLMEILPPNEMARWDGYFGQDDKDRVAECKYKMEAWYDNASIGLLPKRDSLDKASESAVSDPVVGFAHDSVVLYTNLMRLVYESAMVQLCHYECSRLVAQARKANVSGTGLPDRTIFAEKRQETQKAAQGVMMCLKTLMQNRLTRWLPLTSIACVSLPLCLSIIDVKLPRQPSLTINVLHDLYDYVRAYQPQQETIDWMANSIRHILDLAGLEHLDRAIVPATGNEAWDTRGNDLQDAAEGLHPSLYLRLALSWSQGVEGSTFLGKRLPTDISLLRVLGSTLLDRIKSDLNQRTQTRTPSARPSIPAATSEDQAMRNRIAAWQAQDQAVSLELGFDPSGLVLGDSNAAANSAPNPGEDQERSTAWKGAASRAFSAEGDAREADLLEAFVFRDQPAGESGDSQVDWRTRERVHIALDQDDHSMSLENAQEGEM